MNQKWAILNNGIQQQEIGFYTLQVNENETGKYEWRVMYKDQLIAHGSKLFYPKTMKLAKEACMKRMNEHKKITNAV